MLNYRFMLLSALILLTESRGEEGERYSRFDRDDAGKGMVPGQRDAEGVDMDEE
jgi:hypothetical protein